MKKLLLLILFTNVVQILFAQKPGQLQGFRLGLETGISPDFGTTQYVNLGVTARYSVHAGPGYAYLGTGYMVSREGVDFQIPLLAGYKVMFSKKFFLAEELGYYFFKDPESYASQTAVHGLSLATSVGIQFGVFDLGLQYDLILNRNNFSTVGFILGWSF